MGQFDHLTTEELRRMMESLTPGSEPYAESFLEIRRREREEAQKACTGPDFWAWLFALLIIAAFIAVLSWFTWTEPPCVELPNGVCAMGLLWLAL